MSVIHDHKTSISEAASGDNDFSEMEASYLGGGCYIKSLKRKNFDKKGHFYT